MHIVLLVCTSQKTKCYKHQTTKDTGNNVCRRIFSFNFLSFIFSFSLADFFQVFKSYTVFGAFGTATNAPISPFTITFAALSLCLKMRRKSILWSVISSYLPFHYIYYYISRSVCFLSQVPVVNEMTLAQVLLVVICISTYVMFCCVCVCVHSKVINLSNYLLPYLFRHIFHHFNCLYSFNSVSF